MPFAFVDTLTENFDAFVDGFFMTVRIVAVSFVIAMVVGTLVAAFRVAPNAWLQRAGALYVEFFRNIPLLVLLIISFAGLRRAGVPISPWVAGTASLGLYTAAYIAEALRSGTGFGAASRVTGDKMLSSWFPRLLMPCPTLLG